MIIGPIFNKTEMHLMDLLIQLNNGTTIMFDGDTTGTGYNCVGPEHDEPITPLHAMLIEAPQEYVKDQSKFCRKCGQSHKTSWCK